jgi:hypothetical protein
MIGNCDESELILCQALSEEIHRFLKFTMFFESQVKYYHEQIVAYNIDIQFVDIQIRSSDIPTEGKHPSPVELQYTPWSGDG